MYKELEAVCYLGDLLSVDVSFYKNEAVNLKNTIHSKGCDAGFVAGG